VDLFDRHWATYRSIVDHDYMEHRAATAVAAHLLRERVGAHETGAPPPRTVDLGCGDLALLGPTLRHLPLSSYEGIDIAANVLPLAERSLEGAPYPRRFVVGDLLAWAEGKVPDDDGRPADLLLSSFAVHHLHDDEKEQFFRAARRRSTRGAPFLWNDLFREPAESLASYVARYSRRVRETWTALDPEEREQVVEHLSTLDHPADREAITGLLEAAGWRWQWVWRGHHSAEAMLLLEAA